MRLGLELILEAGLERAVEQRLGAGVGLGGAGGEAVGELFGFRLQVRFRDDEIDQSEIARGGGVEAVGQHGQFHRLVQADQARQEEGGRAVRAGADQRIGHGEHGAVGGDHHVAGHGQREPGAGAGAVHAGDHRLGHAAQRDDRRVQIVGQVHDHAR